MAIDSSLEVAHSPLPEHDMQQPQKEHRAHSQWYEASHEEDTQGFQTPHSDHRTTSVRKYGPTWLLALVALVTAIVVGAAVGGGLGSQLSKRECRLSECVAQHASTERTVTVTASASQPATTSGGLLVSYAPVPPTEIYSLALECDDGSTYTTRYMDNATPQTFTKSCSTSLTSGDLGANMAYTFEDCIEACAAYNVLHGQYLCTRALFHSVVNYDDIGHGLSCWQKSSNATISPPYFGAENMEQYSAVASILI
ncbi:hypothetical protein LTR37_009232 [Vermiconidia calcicola]|uniref:Uncharacterized protein n=1 Tax=Vermiconidia calcicola TaxID=1690605 RepID=A0ACC3N9Q7_9PEZI|nr:hypothetical protein LTR37_009232 [Vermiconidia calcicola]